VGAWARFPRFKKRLRSFVFPQLNKEVIKGNRVNLPKIGWVRMRLSRPVPEGFIESYLATSAGELVENPRFENPRFFVNGQRKLKSLQRQLKRRKQGSKRWLKLQKRIARHHEYLANARKDFQFKLAHHLCD